MLCLIMQRYGQTMIAKYIILKKEFCFVFEEVYAGNALGRLIV